MAELLDQPPSTRRLAVFYPLGKTHGCRRRCSCKLKYTLFYIVSKANKIHD
jgi:hypothetical protein